MYRVCSKLFLAGEYSITKPNNTAIILALPKYTYATVQQNQNKIYSTLFDYAIDFDTMEDKNYQLIIDTIQFIKQYLLEINILFKPFSITIDTELYDNKKKYGLGSSGAIVVLLIKTILETHKIPYTNLLLFKLAAIFLMKKNNNGSFADIACIAYNDNVVYTNFDRCFFSNDKSITALLDSDWNSLKIKQFKFQIPTTMLVVWSKITADSSKFVREIALTDAYCQNTNELVNQLIIANQNQDVNAFIKIIKKLRIQLQTLSPKIEIKPLTTICNIAETHHACAKSSGAGGGDCALVFTFDEHTKNILQDKLTYPIILEVTYES